MVDASRPSDWDSVFIFCDINHSAVGFKNERSRYFLGKVGAGCPLKRGAINLTESKRREKLSPYTHLFFLIRLCSRQSVYEVVLNA